MKDGDGGIEVTYVVVKKRNAPFANRFDTPEQLLQLEKAVYTGTSSHKQNEVHIMKTLFISLMFFGLLTAYAGTNYRLNLYRPTVVNGTELKAGECKVELHDNRILIKQGKTTAEATVKVEEGTQKFFSTTVGYAGDGAGKELQEIRLGGTATKVTLEVGASAGSK